MTYDERKLDRRLGALGNPGPAVPSLDGSVVRRLAEQRHLRRRLHLRIGAVVAAGVLVAAGVGTGIGLMSSSPNRTVVKPAHPGPSATSPTSPNTYKLATGAHATLLCSSSGLSLLSVTPSGDSSSELVETRDFVHFDNVTPRFSSSLALLDRWTSAACPSRRQLLVVASRGDGSLGWLISSSDGGLHWAADRRLWIGSGGLGSVAFPNDAIGFLVAGNPTESSGAVSLSRTTNGGSSWKTVPVPSSFLIASHFRVPSFANEKTGFVAETSLTIERSSTIRSKVMKTTDAGSSWTTAHVPVPGGKETMYERPRFFGRDGIVPAVVIEPTLTLKMLAPHHPAPHATARVVIEQTTDTGKSWKSWPAASLGVPVELGGPGDLYGTPSVSAANPSTVWVGGVGESDHVELRVTHDGGRSWSAPAAQGLPRVTRLADWQGGAGQPVTIQAVTARIALASLVLPRLLSPVTYLTLDGGAHWFPFSKG